MLIDELGLESRDMDADKLAFIIAPNINALGRLKSAEIAVELLTGDGKSDEELREIAQAIVKNNYARKSIQESAMKICGEVLASEDCGDYFPIIYAPGAHEGVTGIVAGSLKDRLYRPVCILTPTADGPLKGTARSIPGVNLYELLRNCTDLFNRFGGHAGACGLSIDESKIGELRARMQEAMKALAEKDPDILTEKIFIEKELDAREKSVSFASALKALAPFGEDNPVPVFSLENAAVSKCFYMGENEQHVRFTARTEDSIQVNCVLFRRAADFRDILAGGRASVCGELSINEYLNHRQLQMIVKDIK
jgi:single-stranded-DNA-specific exonuclease